MSEIEANDEPAAWLRHGEKVPVQNVPFGSVWISDKDDPRAFPVYAAPDGARARIEYLEATLRHIALVGDEVSDERFRAFALLKARAALGRTTAQGAMRNWKEP